tara:strand:- start:537 stop:1418 length:882 start_codon:yes stop_codon:yes gene_type:complete
MNKFDKNMVLEKYNDDIELIKYISETLNIHIERLKIIEKKNDNIEKIIITNNQFILIINDNEIINTDIHLQEYQENKTITNYIIVQDIIQNNDTTYDKKYNEVTNSIMIINDENILSKEYCNEVIRIIDEVIKSKKNQIEKWKSNQNVNCLYFNSDSNKFIEEEKIKKLDDTVFKIISKVIGILKHKYGITSTGDSGYCFRKIYGPTRLHMDGVIINPINNRLSVRKVRNMSIIIALNSDYEGGEFYFPKQDYRIKLKQGDIICFPPYYTHPHMVDPVLNRTYRYTINTWLYE